MSHKKIAERMAEEKYPRKRWPEGTLDEVRRMAVYLAHENYFNLHEGTPAKRSGNFRARIKNALKLKADIASAPPTDNT